MTSLWQNEATLGGHTCVYDEDTRFISGKGRFHRLCERKRILEKRDDEGDQVAVVKH